MGRELQKKKNKSSLPRVKHKPKSKKLPIKGNAIVAANWSRHETLSQNYRRLGLVSKLNARAGGVEIATALKSNSGIKAAAEAAAVDPLAIRNTSAKTLVLGTRKVVRDLETGAIVRVVRDEEEDDDGKGKRKRKRRWAGRELVDPMGSSESEEEGKVEMVSQHGLPPPTRLPSARRGDDHGRVVQELEAQSSRPGLRKRARQRSRREEEWIERLVERHGDDVAGMARDRRLNVMQQSEGDIRRRVRAWREGRRKKDDDRIHIEGEEIEA
ncbi:MAG: hypothetical protein Q9201_006886 [Fulgogasparrea decipioides]